MLTIGIIGYAATSILQASYRVDSAERTLNTVVSHQNSLNSAFGDIDTQLTALNTSNAFDSAQALALVDRSIAGSRAAMRTINDDERALGAATNDVRALPWLTVLGRASLDRDAVRIAHAEKALAAARTVAADQVVDGQFWRALYAGLSDFSTLSAQSSSNDLEGARATLAKMKSGMDLAAAFSGAPGLPSELGSLMTDLQAFVADFGRKLDAEAAGDDAALSAADASVGADVTKISTHDIDRIGAEIDAFYRPLIDRYNSEITAATA